METKVDEAVGYKEALDRIMSELGIPGEGYPAPVENAWHIAEAALLGHRYSLDDLGDKEYSDKQQA